MSESAKLVKTSTPGIFKKGNRYVVVYRAGGRQRKEFARTFAEARAIKSARQADIARGEFQVRTSTTLRGFLSEWIDRYQGTGRRGFREGTRQEYRRLLDQYAHRYFSERLRLVDVTPQVLAQFVGWLADDLAQGRRVEEDRRAADARRRDLPVARIGAEPITPVRLADTSIRNVLVPVRAALATAMREGLIRQNPASGIALPVRAVVEPDDDADVKALSRTQLAALLEAAPDRYHLLIELVAATGMRISEAIALQRRHIELGGATPHVKVRRAIVKRRVEPPKSRHGKRSIALSSSLASRVRSHTDSLDSDPSTLVFASRNGTPLDPDNIRKRILKPLFEEVGAPWAGWHTLRHTFASLQLARGVNIVALSRALGHHSAAFTLEIYVHLLEGDEAPALELDAIVGDVQEQLRVPNHAR